MRKRLPRVLAALAILTICGAAVVASRQTPTPSGQTFRAGTDLLLFDVSVLDKARHSVRDLKQSDFTVLVDGKPRPVVAFKAVDVPPPPPAPSSTEAKWVHDVAPDVATNEKKPGRVFVILLDDYSFLAGMVDPAGIISARQTALAVVDAMGPDDRAAVVMSGDGHTSQDFTSDRQLLRTAINDAPLFPRTTTMPGETPEEEILDSGFGDCGACNIQMLDRIALAMRALTEQRKVLFHISAGSVVKPPTPALLPGRDDHCSRIRREALQDAVRHAQLANVTIESFDPRLLQLNEPGLPLVFLQRALQPRFQFTLDKRESGRVWIVKYEERARPTVFRHNNTQDNPSSGRFWIDVQTGEIAKAEMIVAPSSLKATFTTTFKHDDRFGIAVPIQMHEQLHASVDNNARRLEGTAEYSNYRRCGVKTEENVK